MLGNRYKYYRLSPEEKSLIKRVIRETLEERGIDLAVLFGSFVELPSFRDIDAAVYAKSGLELEDVFKLAAELEERLRIPVDVVPLDQIPAEFRHHVLTVGEVILEREPGLRQALLARPPTAQAGASGGGQL